MNKPKDLLHELYESAPVKDKVEISRTYSFLGNEVTHQNFLTRSEEKIKLGDDCAVIKDGQGGYLLFASEGIIPTFTSAYPWFAGYSAIMVNISDICSMGGLPLAVTDSLWTRDHQSAGEIWKGMLAASRAYGVPIVGGHTCYHSEPTHLAVSIIGKAEKLLTSFDACPGEDIIMAVDLNGAYFADYPFWNASTTSSPEKLQSIIKLPKKIADSDLSKSAKDISMGGVIGTLDMLTRTSEVGASINLDNLPKPDHVTLKKWLMSFPSYGYLLTCPRKNSQEIMNVFHQQDIAANIIGSITEGEGIQIT